MALHRIERRDLRVGQPLLWPVYDEHGHLLLRQGYVIETEHQLEMLIENGVYANRGGDLLDSREPSKGSPAPEKFSALTLINDVHQKFERATSRFTVAEEPDYPARIWELAKEIDRLMGLDPDAVVGSMHLDHDRDYAFSHAVNTACLCALVGRRLTCSEEERSSTICAALTMNIAMIDLQRVFFQQQEALTAEQSALLERHPEGSAEMLEKAGVSDPIWLESVRHHHEHFDGTGYPGKLKGEGISLGGRLLMLADGYCSMITPRAYRPGIMSTQALRTLFLASGKRLDPHLTQLLVKEMGVYPPGTVVRLQDGELAVITHRGTDSSAAVAHALVGPRGAALSVPIRRYTGKPTHAIQEAIPREKLDMAIASFRLWS
jgi:HD-GYP domain-containing protein (c-di-GMP phosphodiesterase class II)